MATIAVIAGAVVFVSAVGFLGLRGNKSAG